MSAELESGAPSRQNTGAVPLETTPMGKRLGPLGPIALALLKFKSLFSFVAFFGFYWTLWGAEFGIGFAVLILIHEMGHFIDIKRRGLPADMPMFLPGFGSVCEVERAGCLAGDPLSGQPGRAMCRRACGGRLLSVVAPDWLWIVGSAGANGAWFNALNLIPLWIFDGSSASNALSKLERAVVLVVTAALGYALGEWVFALVAAGMGIRLFTRDAPEEPKQYDHGLLCGSDNRAGNDPVAGAGTRKWLALAQTLLGSR